MDFGLHNFPYIDDDNRGLVVTGQKTWLIFWTRGGEELKTKEKIEKLVRDLKLQDKVEKVFVPTTRTTRYNKKRVKPKLYDIVINNFPKDLPLEFPKLISAYPLGFKGKLAGGIGYDYEEISKNTYRLKKLDRSRLSDIFKNLSERGLKPAILGVKEKESEELMNKLSSMGFSVERVKSALKPQAHEIETQPMVVEKPMYNGYIFIFMEEDQAVIDKITQIISNTRPIRAKDPATGLPVYIHASEEDIKKIEELMARQEREKSREAPFVKGDKVKITEGTLKGREGEVVDVDLDKGVLTVRVSLFGRPQEVPVKFTQVERLEV